MSDVVIAPEENRPFDSVGATTGPAWFDRAARWLNARARFVLATAIAFHVIVLLTMIALHAAPYLFGETILLKVVPVDPRDIFRGDFVILNYDFNRVPVDGIEGIPDATNSWWRARELNQDQWLDDRAVYVSLEKDAEGNHWHATKFSVNRPSSGLFIRGKYVRNGSFTSPLQFGIEAYYVQEGEGHVWEEARNQHHLSAEIALAPWGQAKLIQLVKDAK